jgi:hypothetical protein
MNLLAKFTGGNSLVEVEGCLRDIQMENNILKAMVQRMESQQSTILSKLEDVIDLVEGVKPFLEKQFQCHEGTVLTLHSDVQSIKKYVASTRKRLIKLTEEIEKPKNEYVANSLDGLDLEKVANEILSVLLSKMENPHPLKLGPFYTDLERVVGKPLSKMYKESVKSVDKSKYPNRKMDFILRNVNPTFVFDYAKDYEFKRIK